MEYKHIQSVPFIYSNFSNGQLYEQTQTFWMSYSLMHFQTVYMYKLL